ncbi:MAG: hypothetical protein QOJ52_2626 [Acidimicrobiaceae bacterium]|jgi:hypothetical protein|nr:hypothetical protein [Acidimicrobiaceae bacterium]MDQ1420664.1 hypothetical protein [Acidimicrobiaceae bacterium]MDQ1442094.1 hypothetical protein [Acidimicrobiaceae bacterium]
MTTTPGRLRLAAGAILVGLLVLAIVGTGALRARQRATTAVSRQGGLLVGAEVIYSSLADADATATNTFLTTLEPPQRRQVYVNDLATATKELARVAGQAGTSNEAADAIAVITKDLPTYSGLIESARANNRLGYPVGAAYLREASSLMQTEVLPAAGQLYQVEAGRLDRAYNSGRSALDPIGMVLAAAVALLVLAGTQLFVARRTNRVMNPLLVVASILTIVLVGWSVVAFSFSGNRLKEAQAKGSDPVQLLSSARILLSRAQVDENLALVARGSGSQYLADFDAVTAELGPADGSSGLLDRAQAVGGDGLVPLAGPGSLYASYLKAHDMVLKAENGNQFATAVELATGSSRGEQLLAATELSDALNTRINQAQTVFGTKAVAATHDLARLSLGVIGLLVLAALLAFLGIEQRINEYR